MNGLLVLLSTLAVASCSPTFGALSGLLGGGGGPSGAAVGLPGQSLAGSGGSGGGLSDALGGLAGSILGGQRPGGRTDRGYKQEGGVYPVGGGGLFQALGFLAQGLTDIVGNAGSILDDVVQLRIPAIVDDAFNAVISVGRALGGIVNALIPGLGTLLGNLVVSIGKIVICLLGSPGLTGSVFGRTPGQDNTRDIPYICTPDYGRNWGCSYNGPYDKADSIINYYKTKDAKSQAQQFIDQYTNGQGVDSLTGSRKIVVQQILILANLMDKGSENWSDDDITNVTVTIIIINGAIADSYQPGLGAQVVDDWITAVKKNNKNKRFPDLAKYRVKIISVLRGATEDQWAGAFNQKKRSGWSKIRHSDNQNDSSSNEQNRGNNSESANEAGSNSDRDSSSNNNNDSSNKSASDSSSDTNSEQSKKNAIDSNNSRNQSNNSNSDNNSNNSNNESNQSDRDRSSDNNSEQCKKGASDSNNSSDQSNNSTSDNNSNKSDKNSSSDKSNTCEKGSSGSNQSNDENASDSNDGNKKGTSSKFNKNTDDRQAANSSSGSGKSQEDANGNKSSEYTFNNAECDSSEQSSENRDDRSSE